MSFRYENYGSANLLINVEGTTVTGLSADQSKTGSAFYQPTQTKCFDIPVTKEIWIKCDIYTTSSYNRNNDDTLRIFSNDNKGANGFMAPNSTNFKSTVWRNDSATYFNEDIIKANNRYRILTHMKSSSNSNNGIVEVFVVNEKTKYVTYNSRTGSTNNGNNFDNVYIQTSGSNILVSNVIISDEAIDINEDVNLGNSNSPKYVESDERIRLSRRQSLMLLRLLSIQTDQKINTKFSEQS